MRVVGRVLGRATADGEVRIGGFALVLRLEPEIPDLGPHEIDGPDVIPDRPRVRERERRAPHGLPPLRRRVEAAGGPLLDLEDLSAQDAHLALQGALDDGDGGHDRDDGRHSGHDADERQDGAELVAEDRSGGHEERVERTHLRGPPPDRRRRAFAPALTHSEGSRWGRGARRGRQARSPPALRRRSTPSRQRRGWERRGSRASRPR